MDTKSEVKAVNNSVKVKINGEWVYRSFEDIKIYDKPLKDYIDSVLDLVIRVNALEKLYSEVETLKAKDDDLEKLIKVEMRKRITKGVGK